MIWDCCPWWSDVVIKEHWTPAALLLVVGLLLLLLLGLAAGDAATACKGLRLTTAPLPLLAAPSHAFLLAALVSLLLPVLWNCVSPIKFSLVKIDDVIELLAESLAPVGATAAGSGGVTPASGCGCCACRRCRLANICHCHCHRLASSSTRPGGCRLVIGFLPCCAVPDRPARGSW
jgi:hypothetical protein